MELKEFISETLIQVIDGVKIAQQYSKDNGALIAPNGDSYLVDSLGKTIKVSFNYDVQNVEFDVAITTSESSGGKGGAGVFVAGISLGAQVKTETVDQTLSHLKFTVPVCLPAQPIK